jgi:hypothetical protein
MAMLGKVVEDICFNNAKNYFGMAAGREVRVELTEA